MNVASSNILFEEVDGLDLLFDDYEKCVKMSRTIESKSSKNVLNTTQNYLGYKECSRTQNHGGQSFRKVFNYSELSRLV